MLPLILCVLAGCSAQLKEQSFIVQDKQVKPYQQTDITKWQLSFNNHQLKPIELNTEDGTASLYGLYLDHKDSNEVVLYIPGNGMKVSAGGIQTLQAFSDFDKDFIIFDRRGLGASNGQSSIANLISDSVAQVRYAKEQLQAEQIIVHGFSLGSFIAAQVTKQVEIDALVLQGSATNVNEWIDMRTPWYVKPFLTVDIDDVFYTVDNKAVVANNYKGPLLIIGGEKDQQTPALLSEHLYQKSQSANKQLLIVDDANHNNMFKSVDALTLYINFLNSISS